MSEQIKPFKESLVKVERLQSSPDDPNVENHTPQWSKVHGTSCSDQTLVIDQSASRVCSLDGGLYSGNVWNDTIRAYFNDRSDAESIEEAWFVRRGTSGNVKKQAQITYLLDQWDGYHKVHIRFPPEVNEGEWDLRVDQTRNYPMYIGTFVKPPEPPPFEETRHRFKMGRGHSNDGGFCIGTSEYYRVAKKDLNHVEYKPPAVGQTLWVQEEDTNIVFKNTVTKVNTNSSYYNIYVQDGTLFSPPHNAYIRLGEPLNPAAPSDRPLVLSYHWTSDPKDEGHAKNGQEVTFRTQIHNPAGIKGGRIEVSLDGINPLTTIQVDKTDYWLSAHQYRLVIKDDMPENTAEFLKVNIKYIRDDGLEYVGNAIDIRITNTPEGSYHYDTRLSHSGDLGGVGVYTDYIRIANYDLNGTPFGPFEVGDSIKWRKLGDEDWIEREITEATAYTGYWKYAWEGSHSWKSGFYEFKEVGDEPEPEPEPEPDPVVSSVSLTAPSGDTEAGQEAILTYTVTSSNGLRPEATFSLVNPETDAVLDSKTLDAATEEVETDTWVYLVPEGTQDDIPVSLVVEYDGRGYASDTEVIMVAEPTPTPPGPGDAELVVTVAGPKQVAPNTQQVYSAVVYGDGFIPKGTVFLNGPQAELGRVYVTEDYWEPGQLLAKQYNFVVNVPEVTRTREGSDVDLTGTYAVEGGDPITSEPMTVSVMTLGEEPPVVIAANKLDSTPQFTDHPDHHNQLATAVNNLTGVVGDGGLPPIADANVDDILRKASDQDGDVEWAKMREVPKIPNGNKGDVVTKKGVGEFSYEWQAQGVQQVGWGAITKQWFDAGTSLPSDTSGYDEGTVFVVYE
jgi:hypothetical protein